jgi:hypothetical protein
MNSCMSGNTMQGLGDGCLPGKPATYQEQARGLGLLLLKEQARGLGLLLL